MKIFPAKIPSMIFGNSAEPDVIFLWKSLYGVITAPNTRLKPTGVISVKSLPVNSSSVGTSPKLTLLVT